LDGRKTVKWACFESFWRVDLRNREIREKDRQMELLCSTIILSPIILSLQNSTIILSLQILQIGVVPKREWSCWLSGEVVA